MGKDMTRWAAGDAEGKFASGYCGVAGGWVVSLRLEGGWQLVSEPLFSLSLFHSGQIGILEARIEDVRG